MDDNQESSSEDGWKVNVPISDVPAMKDAPEKGYALVEYTKDGDAFCLDLESLKPSPEDPMGDDSDYDSLSQALSKTIKKMPSTDEGDEG